MPTHVYRPLRNPPNWVDRLLVHPMDTTAATIFVFVGVVAGVSVLFDFSPSKSMEALPFILVLVCAGFLVAGGIFILIGLNWWGDEVSWGWAIERFGWLLGAGGMLTYGSAVWAAFPGSIFSWSIVIFLGLGSVLRFWSIVMIEKTTRQTIREVKGGSVGL